MSTKNGEIIFSIGQRLRNERERLGYKSQAVLAELLGTAKKTITNWELDITAPDARQLVLMHGLNFDVYYILTGERLPFIIKDSASYSAAAHKLAGEIAGMPLSKDDADLLLAVAVRLSEK